MFGANQSASGGPIGSGQNAQTNNGSDHNKPVILSETNAYRNDDFRRALVDKKIQVLYDVDDEDTWITGVITGRFADLEGIDTIFSIKFPEPLGLVQYVLSNKRWQLIEDPSTKIDEKFEKFPNGGGSPKDTGRLGRRKPTEE